MYSKSNGSMHCSWHNAEAEIHKFRKVVTVYSATINFTASQRFAVWACTFGWDLLFLTVLLISSLLFHFIYVLVFRNPKNQKKIKIKKTRKQAKPCLASSFVPLLSLHINQNRVDRLSNSTDLLKAKDTAVHSSFDPTNSHRETAALV